MENKDKKLKIKKVIFYAALFMAGFVIYRIISALV